MECGYCIFERLRNEGMWDRFGPTEQEEIEVMCNPHLLESYEFHLKHPYFFDNKEQLSKSLEMRKKELEKRNLVYMQG